MANNLNITTGNLGNDSEKFFLYSPAVYVDLHDGSGSLGLGYLESEISFKGKQTYATFKTGIPKTEVRRDMIEQEFTLEGTVMQVQPETLALIMQRRYDDEDEVYDRVIIGSQLPAMVYPSVILIGQAVSGDEVRLYIRRLMMTVEDLDIKLGGDDYSRIPFKGTAVVDDDPLTTNPTWPYNSTYGTQDNIAFWAFPKSFSSTS